MKAYEEELKKIKKFLLENPRGLTISEISEKLNINRNSVAKYLDVLTISGHVEMRSAGPAKLYYLSQRVPISAMLNFSSDYVLVLNKELKIIEINDNFLKLVNAQRDALLGQGIEDFPHSVLTNPEMILNLTNALNGKETTREIELKTDKKQFYFSIKLVPTTFEDGDPGVTLLLEDITKHKMTDEKLRQNEEKLRSLIYSMDDLVFVIGLDGKFKNYYQPSDRKDLYIPPEQFLGKHFKEATPPHLSALIQTAIENIKATGKTQQFDYPLEIKGKKFHFNAKVSPIKNHSGSFDTVVGVVCDITEHKKNTT